MNVTRLGKLWSIFNLVAQGQGVVPGTRGLWFFYFIKSEYLPITLNARIIIVEKFIFCFFKGLKVKKTQACVSLSVHCGDKSGDLFLGKEYLEWSGGTQHHPNPGNEIGLKCETYILQADLC
jgi:hypothetical protein